MNKFIIGELYKFNYSCHRDMGLEAPGIFTVKFNSDYHITQVNRYDPPYGEVLIYLHSKKYEWADSLWNNDAYLVRDVVYPVQLACWLYKGVFVYSYCDDRYYKFERV